MVIFRKKVWCLLLCFACMLNHANGTKHSVDYAQEGATTKKKIEELQEGLSEAEKYTYSSRGLLILLDDIEPNMGALHGSLFIALAQKPGIKRLSRRLLR